MRYAISILLALLAVNAANAQAFVGRWYGDNYPQACKGKRGDRIAPIEYTATEVYGMETPCQIVKWTPKGAAVEMTLRCRDERGRYDAPFRETIVVQGQQLKNTKVFEGKKMTFTYKRCP